VKYAGDPSIAHASAKSLIMNDQDRLDEN
jgi:hypothetical protein